MNEIKAIETTYNGHRYRSRLEARWAVFFDACHIIYEYEPECFEISGKRYLPDFYLPEYQLHVEVKPDRLGAELELEKVLPFIEERMIQRLLVLPAIPYSHNKNGVYLFTMLYADNGSLGSVRAKRVTFYKTIDGSGAFDDSIDNESCVVQYDSGGLVLLSSSSTDSESRILAPYLAPFPTEALDIARQERFEKH